MAAAYSNYAGQLEEEFPAGGFTGAGLLCACGGFEVGSTRVGNTKEVGEGSGVQVGAYAYVEIAVAVGSTSVGNRVVLAETGTKLVGEGATATWSLSEPIYNKANPNIKNMATTSPSRIKSCVPVKLAFLLPDFPAGNTAGRGTDGPEASGSSEGKGGASSRSSDLRAFPFPGLIRKTCFKQ